MERRRAVAVMCKAPVPGLVKTRFSPALSPEEAALLYSFFVRDFFERVKTIEGADKFAAFTPEERRDEVASLVPKGVRLMAQKGCSLGERMYNVFNRLFEEGYGSVVVTGSDSPDLPLRLIYRAFEILEGGKKKLVFGPATDGGYYLVAANTLAKAPFDETIPWGTAEVLEKTIEKLEEASLAYELLSPWHDVDSFEDLKFLRDSLETPLSSKLIKSFDSLG